MHLQGLWGREPFALDRRQDESSVGAARASFDGLFGRMGPSPKAVVPTLAAGAHGHLFPNDDCLAADQPTKDRKFRVRNNALGTADFSPVVRREALPKTPSLPELLDKARETLASVAHASLHERALTDLHLSETRSCHCRMQVDTGCRLKVDTPS